MDKASTNNNAILITEENWPAEYFECRSVSK